MKNKEKKKKREIRKGNERIKKTEGGENEKNERQN